MKQVRSFLALVGYCRKFIPNLSERAAVLTDLTKGKNPCKFQWNITHQLAFQHLKAAVQNPPVLRPPHREDEFVLQVDASNRGLWEILSQKDQEGENTLYLMQEERFSLESKSYPLHRRSA